MSDAFVVLADAYLDGSLDEAGAERLLGYLRDSPAATTHLRALAAIDAGLRGLSGQRAEPAAIRRGVLARIKASGQGRGFRDEVERRIAAALPSSRRLRAARRRPGSPWGPALLATTAVLAVAAAVAGVAVSRPRSAALAADGTPALAVLEAVEGWVTVEHGDQADTAASGRAVGPGDVVVTASGAAASLRLPDGTRLRLGSAGALQLPAPDGARARLQRGEVDAQVAPQAPGAPPILSTPVVSIAVLGTEFTVGAWPEATLVRVAKGVVAMRASTARAGGVPDEWRVAAGESLRLAGGRAQRTVALPLRRRSGEDWHLRDARTLAGMVGYAAAVPPLDAWGGRADLSMVATGAFRVEASGGRWWTVDPDGHPAILAAVSNVRHALGDDRTLLARFGSHAGWASATAGLLADHGFAVGPDSDHEALGAARRARGERPVDVVAAEVSGSFASAYLRRHGALAEAPAGRRGAQFLAPLLPGFAAHVAAWERSLAGTLAPERVAGVITDRFPYLPGDWAVVRRWTVDPEVRAVLDGWLATRHRTLAEADAGDLEALRCACIAAYRDLVFPAFRRAAPRVPLFGMAGSAGVFGDGELGRLLCEPVDVVCVHLIGVWLEDPAELRRISERWHRPLWIDGIYAKGADSGLRNRDGAGLEVPGQADRARFYQHLALIMLESRVVVGWQWYRYEDLGDEGVRSPADYDSNKGIVDPRFTPYRALLDGMGAINRQRYGLADWFDERR